MSCFDQVFIGLGKRGEGSGGQARLGRADYGRGGACRARQGFVIVWC